MTYSDYSENGFFPTAYDCVLKCLNKGNFYDYYLVKNARSLSRGSAKAVCAAKSKGDCEKVVGKTLKKNVPMWKVTYTHLQNFGG